MHDPKAAQWIALGMAIANKAFANALQERCTHWCFDDAAKDVFNNVLWLHLPMPDHLLAAVAGGLAVNWKNLPGPHDRGESSQAVAEMAERLVDAIMRIEERRS